MSNTTIPSADFRAEFFKGSGKAAMRAVGGKEGALWMVPPSAVRVKEGLNGRVRSAEYLDHLERVTQSMVANGYDRSKPLSCYVANEDGENVIYAIDGHTRLEAVAGAIARGRNIERIPVTIAADGTSYEDLLVSMVTGNEGRPFTPYEKAIFVKRLLGEGLDEATIAERLCITPRWVKDLLLLVEAPKPVRDMITKGEITSTLAIQELQKSPKKAVERLTKAVEKAKASGKKKASKKHLDDGLKKRTKPVQLALEESTPPGVITWDMIVAADSETRFTETYTPDAICGFLAALLADAGLNVQLPSGDITPIPDLLGADDL
ncbi:MAG: hypothetical protein WCY11_21185 [Novosphingobium sp.]